MQHPQPIVEWFGLDPVYVAPKEVYTREQRRKAKEDVVQVVYEETPGITADEEWFRHHNWKAKRAIVHQALTDAGSSTATIDRFRECGAACQVEWSDELQRYRVCACYCHNRHCEPCMKAKASLITANLREKMKGLQHGEYHFITLTLCHSAKPLADQIKRLNACYKKLRATDEWLYGQVNADRIFAASKRGTKHSAAVKVVSHNGQRGGAATLEIKWNPERKEWHPHLHIISQGSQITNHRLKDLWYAITGDSWECDCRTISADKDVAYYVGKYVTKGTNEAVWADPATAAEWVTAIKGVRMCATFGTWRGFKLTAKPKEKPGQWKSIGSLGSFVRRAQAGEVHALNLLRILTESCQYNPSRKRQPKPK